MAANTTNYRDLAGPIVGYACEVTVRFYNLNAHGHPVGPERKASTFVQGNSQTAAKVLAQIEVDKQLAMDGTIAAWASAVAVPVTQPAKQKPRKPNYNSRKGN